MDGGGGVPASTRERALTRTGPPRPTAGRRRPDRAGPARRLVRPGPASVPSGLLHAIAMRLMSVGGCRLFVPAVLPRSAAGRPLRRPASAMPRGEEDGARQGHGERRRRGDDRADRRHRAHSAVSRRASMRSSPGRSRANGAVSGSMTPPIPFRAGFPGGPSSWKDGVHGDEETEHGSRWAAIRSVAEKVGCNAETLRLRVRRSERDRGARPGPSPEERDRLKTPERGNRELRQAESGPGDLCGVLPVAPSTCRG